MKKENIKERKDREKLFKFFYNTLEKQEATKSWAFVSIYTFFIELFVYKLINVTFQIKKILLTDSVFK
jgi:hypothetical protein